MTGLRGAAGALSRQRGVIVLALLASVGAAIAVMLIGDPAYRAASVVTVEPADAATVARCVALIEGDAVRAIVVAAAGGGLVPDVRASAGEGGVIRISVRTGDADTAAAYANAYTDAFAQTQAGAAVTVAVVERAVPPDTPVSPDPTFTLLVAVLAGAVIGAVGALVADRLLDVITTERQLVDEAHRAPVLGVVDQGADVAVAVRSVCDELDAVDMRIVQVTAVDDDVLGAVIAIGLARASAERGESVVLADVNLREPHVHRELAVAGNVGVVDALHGELLEMTALPLDDGLTVLAAGRRPTSAPRTIGSAAMEELIVELDQRYSVVVMCSSSATPYGDAAVLSRLADGVVVVVGEGSSRRQLGAALDALDVADAPIAGLVLQRGTR